MAAHCEEMMPLPETDPAAPLPVLGVASEMFPLVKTGGLADVVGALPKALAPHGIRLSTLLPGYPAVLAALERSARESVAWPEFFGGPARLLEAALDDATPLVVLDAPHLYERPGNPYVDASGRDWPDNGPRFAALACAGARIAMGPGGPEVPRLLHLHDWQAALAPAYLRYLGGGTPARTLLTLHNLAFQGLFDMALQKSLGLPAAAYTADGLEYHGQVGFLKAGILLADAITTVSPTYAQEILAPADGMGLDGILRWRQGDLVGIVNGLDTEVWDPARDAHLARPYSLRNLQARAANKRAVEQRFGLPPEDSLLVAMVSRLTAQKGIDLVAQSLDAIVAAGARLAVLGSGDAALEAALEAGAQRHPGRVALRLGYDEGLSHLMQGGCDAILVPSRFEPCGLTQLAGLRYGCVPIVTRVGGLADTVIDANHAALGAQVATGFVLREPSAIALQDALAKAARLHREQPAAWRRLQRNGMRAEVGWSHSAARYAALYRRLGVS